MPSLYFAFPMLFLLLIFSLFSSAHLFHDDRQSLLQFKKLITSDPDHSMVNWNPAVHLCNWSAITCSHRHRNRVVALNLTALDLHGTISPSLSNLSFLRSLDLSGNAFHGHIPPELGRLFRLRTLSLYHNQLEGNIPHQLGNCTNMILLVLSFNDISGNIPEELGSLPHLQQVFLGANRLTEYGLGEIVSTKGDVYSYGVLLLEMLTRKRPTSDMFVGDLNLHKWVNLAFPNHVKEVIDRSLFSEVDEDELKESNVYKCLLSLLHVGLCYSKDSPEERPTMRDVVMVLESIREDMVPNTMGSKILRQSMSYLLSDTNATMNDAPASNDQSSSTL